MASSAGWRISLCIFLLIAPVACDKHKDAVAPTTTASPSASPLSNASQWFVDVTDAAHLNFTHDCGKQNGYFMPQIIGSGAALFDYDKDGRLDIYLINNGGPDGRKNQLFHQEADGTFKDVSAGSGLDVAGYGMGVAIGDVNNDGLPDLLLTEYGRIRLFLNNGDGTFTDVTKDAGLDDPLWATSAAFFDYDRDGWLDLVVTNYVDYDHSRPCGTAGGEADYCPPGQFLGTTTKLYHNLGATLAKSGKRLARFEDVTLQSGLAKTVGPGLGVICLDFNGDGWPDILIANDEQPNRLWINQHDGTFVDEAMLRGIAYNAMGRAEANMGIAAADADGNGMFSILITHLTEESDTLWKQDRRGIFQDHTAAAGLAAPSWKATGFGVVMADFDNDGWPDIAIATGRISHKASIPDSPLGPFFSRYAERNQLLTNDPSAHGRFRDVSSSNSAFCGAPNVARGLASGDIFNDGGIALLVTAVGAPARLYRNVAPHRGHWLNVRAVEPQLGGRDAYGAEVSIEARGRTQVGWVNAGGSYLCSNDPRVHFGLGAAESIDAVHVVWANGNAERFAGGAADRAIVVQHGAGVKER